MFVQLELEGGGPFLLRTRLQLINMTTYTLLWIRILKVPRWTVRAYLKARYCSMYVSENGENG